MFFAAIFIVFLIFSFYVILRRFGEGILNSSCEMLAAAIPLSFAFFAGLTSLFTILLPTFLSALIVFSITIICAAIAFTKIFKQKKNLWISNDSILTDKIFYFGLTIIVAGFLIVSLLNIFIVQNDGSVSMPQGAGVDAPYHLAQIIRIGSVQKWDFEEPYFSGEFIRYPFFINFFSGVLLKFGSPLGFAYNAPLVLLALSGIFLLVSFFRFLGFKKILLALAVLAVLFGSNLGYIAYFKTHGAVGIPIRNNVPYPMQNISYPGMIPGFLTVQRPFLLGFPLFLLVLIFFLKGIQKKHFPAIFLSGIVLGILPFSHTHSFLAAVLTLGCATIYFLLSRDELFYKTIRGVVFPSFFIAIPQLASLLILPKYPLAGIVSFRLGWMAATPINNIGGLNLPSADYPKFFPWLRYIWTNFGFLLCFPVIVAAFFKKMKRNIVFIILALGALALWIIPNIIQFQVWDFDNNKFFSYAILLSVAALGMIIYSLNGAKKRIAAVLFGLFILFSLPASIVASLNVLRHRDNGRVVIFTEVERKAGEWFKKNTDENVSILSSSALLIPETIQNPVAVAAGRKTTLGFITWLYTHGIDFFDRLNVINAFFENPADFKTAQKFFEEVPADYLLMDEIFRQKYPQLEKKLTSLGYKKVYGADSFSIISLKR